MRERGKGYLKIITASLLGGVILLICSLFIQFTCQAWAPNAPYYNPTYNPIYTPDNPPDNIYMPYADAAFQDTGYYPLYGIYVPYTPPPGFVRIGNVGLNPNIPPENAPAGGRYVVEDQYPDNIDIRKYVNEGKPKAGFNPKSLSFRIKSRDKFEFEILESSSERFYINFTSSMDNHLDEAILDGEWQNVEWELDLPQDYNGGCQVDDIIVTSDEGEELVIDDFEYSDDITNHGWEIIGIGIDKSFKSFFPVYNNELNSLVFECNESYGIGYPRTVYRAGDTTYPLAGWTPSISRPSFASLGQYGMENFSSYQNQSYFPSNNFSTGTSYGFQYPASFQNQGTSFPYNPAFGNQLPAYGYRSDSFGPSQGNYFSPYNPGYGNTGYSSGFGASPFWGNSQGNFWNQGGYPGYGGNNGWMGQWFPF